MPGTVLCVDDDRNLCRILAQALAGEGHRTLTAFDGERGLASVAEDAPDLVLLDLLLPRRDGFAVLEAIRAMGEPACATPVVLLTGCSPTPEYGRRAAGLGAAALLAKPVPLDSLLGVVARLLGEAKRPVPGATAGAGPVAHRPGPRLPGEGPEQAARRAELAALAERFRGQSPWEILGLAEDAGEEEIRTAFTRLAERAHPDRVAASSGAGVELAREVFEHLSRAYQTLIDPRRRQQCLLERRREDREAAEREESRRALDAEIEFQRGGELLRRRQYPGARDCFARAVELYPSDGEYHAHYGWALHLCRPRDPAVTEEAIRHLRRALKLASRCEKSYLFMGRLCQASGRAAAAEKMFSRAVQIRPDCVEALRELRLINMRREREKGLIGRLFRR